MDTSVLDFYDPYVPKQPTVLDERKVKDDAFYTASSVAPPEDVEQVYDQILSDVNRFGTSPIVDQFKENYKAAKRQRAEVDVSDILLSQAPIEEKVEAVKTVTWKIEQDPEPKEIFKEQVATGKPPMEIPVYGGAELKNSPRGEISGTLADILLKAKAWADQYEVKDWVPLLGGIGVGELWAGDFPELMDEISYHGWSALVKGGNVATGGLGTLTIDRRALDGIFLGLDVTAVGGLATEASRAVVKNAVKKAITEKRIEPFFPEEVGMGKTIWFDPSTPVGEVTRINKPAAADLAAKSVMSPKMADAAGTDPISIVQHNILPKLDPEIKGIVPDAYESLEAMDRQFIHYFDASKIDPYLFDPTAIKKDVNLHFDIIRSQSEVTPMMASSYIEDTGRAFRGKIVYGKAANKGFTDDEELVDMMVEFNKKVAEKYNIKPDRVKTEVITDPQTGEKYFTWDFFRAYDPVQDTFFGLGSSSAAFGPMDVSGFAGTAIGKLFYSPSTRLDKWITEGFSRAEIRSSNLKKVWADVMRNEVLSVKPRQELAQAIYKSEELGKHLTVSDLRTMFPMMEAENFKSLVSGYNHFRRLDEHMYMVTNSVYRGQKVTAGMKGMYDQDGRYLENLGKKVEKDPDYLDEATGELMPGKKLIIGSDGSPPSAVWDFSLVDGVGPDGKNARVQKGEKQFSELDVDNIDIFRLDQPLRVDGKMYEFGINVREGRVPERLLPRIEGHYPHINDEPYFIKAIPKKLVINGREIPRTQENEHLFIQQASTVGVARSQKAADKYARAMQKENKDFEYRAVFERTEIDDNLRTSLQSVKYAQDLAKSRREERLMLPDGTLGRLEDPAVALDKRLNQTARLYGWKDIDFEFRRKYMESYGIYSQGKFPESVDDIKIDPNIATKEELRNYTNAVNIFEQYAKQQHSKDTFLDPAWRSATLKTAQMMEEVADKGFMPDFSNWVADSMRQMSHNREPFISTALKVATVKYIHWNPIRQWIVQPAQMYELHAMALMDGNTKFSRDMINIMPHLFTDSLSRTGKWVPEDIRSYFKSHGHVGTGYTNKEWTEIMDAFYDSGISKSIDLQAVVDGVFRSTSDKIDVGAARHTADRAGSVATGVAAVPRQVGFNSAELLNNIGLWLYARSDFIKKNPTKKWNDPHNLELIAAKSQQVGNNMLTRSDLLPYQEGTARAFMQFMAYTNKAVMQPFNSKGLTKSEKIRLAAARTALYGTTGFLGGSLILDQVKKAYYEDHPVDPSDVETTTLVEEIFELAERGLTDKMLNGSLRLMFDGSDPNDPKTDLAMTKSLAPAPEFGVPLGDLVWDTLELLKGEGRLSDKLPLLSATSSIFDTVNIMSDALYTKKFEDESSVGIAKYILKTSEFASGYSNFEKGLAMLHWEALVNKAGNPMDVSATAAEAIAKIVGVQSMKNIVYYETLKKDAKLKKEIQSSAKKIIESLDALADIYDPIKAKGPAATPEEQLRLAANQIDRANHLITIYAKVPGLEEELRSEVRTQMDKMERKGMLPLIQRIANRESIKYDKDRRMMAERLGQLRGKGGKDLDLLLSNLFAELESKPMEIEVTGEKE